MEERRYHIGRDVGMIWCRRIFGETLEMVPHTLQMRKKTML